MSKTYRRSPEGKVRDGKIHHKKNKPEHREDYMEE